MVLTTAPDLLDLGDSTPLPRFMLSCWSAAFAKASELDPLIKSQLLYL